jgi:hypothetical protein
MALQKLARGGSSGDLRGAAFRYFASRFAAFVYQKSIVQIMPGLRLRALSSRTTLKVGVLYRSAQKRCGWRLCRYRRVDELEQSADGAQLPPGSGAEAFGRFQVGKSIV